MWGLGGRADAVTGASEGVAALVGGWTGGRVPVTVIGDPAEDAIRPPGGDPGRTPLRLLWFGSPTNAGLLNAHMPGLIALSERVPLELALVSTGAAAFEGLTIRYGPTSGRPLQVRFVEWSVEAQAHELERTDLVLLPGDLAADSGLKSANRLIAAPPAGRYCGASPPPSHRPYAIGRASCRERGCQDV